MSTPSGRVEVRDGQHVLVLTRTFRAPVEDVWAAITEPDRLARWIGTWTGDPASGTVTWRMLFEGDDPGDEMTIRVCEPPHRLHVTSRVGEELWRYDLDLTHADGVTTLTFAQPGIAPGLVGDVGPGWDYYLDRMVDVETGNDPALRSWDDYAPTGAHYTSQV